jgi:DtxR family Mn-dependent transcriptional regulator
MANIKKRLEMLGSANYNLHRMENGDKHNSATKTGKTDLTASLEDYLEAIYNVADDSGQARSTDVAEVLDVSKASVTGACRILRQKGLIEYKPYEALRLTEQGRSVASEVQKRHDLLTDFFTNILGVDIKTAQQAACEAEHSMGPKISSKLIKFMEFVGRKHGQKSSLVEQFRRYCEDDKYETSDDETT